ncbi:MAG TPA: aspartate aminotransferase family protein [Actinomycetota bacterium]|nr:aspartate aminotransferase family protein [Actinomycetota bacterium]
MQVVEVEHLKARAAEIAEREEARLLERTPGSARLHRRAVGSLPKGVASNFQANDPYPVYLSRGRGSRVWDVDGTEYVDFHGGFGVNVVGHAHPKIVEAIRKVADQGIHFAVTTEATVALAEAICERFQLEQMRFVNSGTEATMDAIRVARAATGRDRIVKMEGSYHGHHDAVLFSVVPESDVLGTRFTVSGESADADGSAYTTRPTSKGVPASMWHDTIIVPFNDAHAVEELFTEHGEEIAALILEPVMMNIGIVVPRPGYLKALRDLCDRHGVVLIYDEVKCGGTIAYGGATERFGVKPHLAAFAKAIGGGATIGAFGGEASVMEHVAKGAAQQGTFNGNPLSVAAGYAALTEVLTKDAYDRLGKLGTMLAEGCDRAIDDTGVPAHTVDLGAKGCVSYRTEPLTNYRDFLETVPELFYASFSWMINRGIFMTPGDEEQWTISVQHTEEDIQRYVDGFSEFCAELVR